jgi:hypothetical protein
MFYNGLSFLIEVFFINGTAKNADSCASDGRPIDIVSAAGLVQVAEV